MVSYQTTISMKTKEMRQSIIQPYCGILNGLFHTKSVFTDFWSSKESLLQKLCPTATQNTFTYNQHTCCVAVQLQTVIYGGCHCSANIIIIPICWWANLKYSLNNYALFSQASSVWLAVAAYGWAHCVLCVNFQCIGKVPGAPCCNSVHAHTDHNCMFLVIIAHIYKCNITTITIMYHLLYKQPFLS